MNIRTIFVAVLGAALWVGDVQPLLAQESDSITADLKAIVDQVNVKLKNGQDKEKDLSENFKQLDDLLAKHKEQKTDIVARILGVKASIYVRVGDIAAGKAALFQLMQEYPGTRTAGAASAMLTDIEKQEAARKLMEQQEAIMRLSTNLVPGVVFPDFSEKDLNGKPLSVAAYRGKVVLIDFWATWCEPCMAEMPNVLQTYQKYHGQGFDIIGISLDQDRQKLASFLAQNGVTWQQYFDGDSWSNKLAAKYGVEAIPSTVLLDREGRIISTGLQGDALGEAVAKAIAKK